MATPMRRPGWLPIFLDTFSYAGGWFLIGYQLLEVPPKDVNEWFLLLGGSLIGVPGIAEILAWRSREAIGTGSSGGSPPPPGSPLPESSSSSST